VSTEHSVVALRAGEQLTERDALMATLLPSANNVAHIAGVSKITYALATPR
jgi:D-alanyl-D-alanine carboxypeptidase